MKWIVAAILAVMGLTLLMLWTRLEAADWHKDPQFAAGEWSIQVQTPPCDDVHNIQVIYPKHSGEPITIECDQMTVNTK